MDAGTGTDGGGCAVSYGEPATSPAGVVALLALGMLIARRARRG